MDGGDLMRHPWSGPPEAGTATEVAPGVLWLRLPLPMVLDHVNIYALGDGESWTLIDTGIHSTRGLALWDKILTGPLQNKPVGRVIVTHHHPDHIGMAGWIMERFGAELWASRTSWLMARMLILDVEERPTPQAIAFWRSGGMDPEILDQRRQTRPFNFADICAPLPVGYRRMQEGEVIRAGGRDWDVRMGGGHAAEHVTLWSRDDSLVIAGDQILPGISPNIGVYPTEPEADPLSDWLAACDRLARHAREDHLVLPGHKLPFTGMPQRMRQLADNHHAALDRLRYFLGTPRTAAYCFPLLFKRRVDAGTYGLALVEAMAHLNHLYHAGEVTRRRRDDDAWLWQTRDPSGKVPA
jgi:glyoxylase-like metal-dependent hydrolase (beta-lactamase superfamily II)